MSDEEIVLAIQRGDESAIAKVMQSYSSLLWSVVGAVLANTATEQDMEECVADVFIYLWKNPDQYNAEKGKLSSWLSVIARTKAIDKYRSIVSKKEVAMEDDLPLQGFDVLAEILKNDNKGKLKVCLNCLEEEDREIVVRRYFREQKPRDIAASMKLSVKQVENRLYQAKLKLRRWMKEKG